MLVEEYALILDYCKDYENFHLYSCKLANKIIADGNFEELEKLEKAIMMVSLKYDTNACSYILDYISLYNAFVLGGKKMGNESENDLQNKIVKNFDKIFPNYLLIKSEYVIDSKNRIDILAKDIKTQRYVIFELKKAIKTQASSSKDMRNFSMIRFL